MPSQCPCKRKAEGDFTFTYKGNTQRGGSDADRGAEIGVSSPQKLEEAKNSVSSGASRERLTRLTPRLQTSGLQSCARIRFCCSKPPSLWHLSQQIQKINPECQSRMRIGGQIFLNRNA